MRTGYMRGCSVAPAFGGLCGTVLYNSPLFHLFEVGRDYGAYWAYDGDINEDDDRDIEYKFTPTRQNIVLLLAAMNNEL